MCTVCGCAQGNVKIGSGSNGHDHSHDHEHSHPHDHDHGHNHDGDHVHTKGDHHHYGHGPAHAHAPGLSQARMVQIETDILSKNNEYAQANRQYFETRGILSLNLVSSPGSGKTTLLAETINRLKKQIPMSVIEGDQQTQHDADRIRATGAKAIQINTGKGCHLDGHMVGHALETLAPENDSIVFIENVGNLVCPAGFDLGEAHKVAILSVTEGEDKPLKYPDMFFASDLMLLNKIDLLPYLNFDVEKCLEYARRVNPKIKIIQLSATSGEGMNQWEKWLLANVQIANLSKIEPVTAVTDRDEIPRSTISAE